MSIYAYPQIGTTCPRCRLLVNDEDMHGSTCCTVIIGRRVMQVEEDPNGYVRWTVVEDLRPWYLRWSRVRALMALRRKR